MPSAVMPATILIVGHGSREPAGNAEIEHFAERARARHPDRRIEVAFLEFAEVLLDEGLDRVAAGSSEVLVVPLIINAAGHVKMQIPQAVAEARQRHPEVRFHVHPHIGASEAVFAALLESHRKALRSLAMPDPQTTGVVLLGRGSSDAGANAELARLARRFWEATDHELVEFAFTGVAYPRLETVVQRLARLGMLQVVVLPVYLFTGTLIQRIRAQIERLRQQFPTLAFAMGDYLGFSEPIAAWFDAAMTQGIQALPHLECDGCKYRAFAAAHGLGYHHDHDGHHHYPAGHHPHDHDGRHHDPNRHHHEHDAPIATMPSH